MTVQDRKRCPKCDSVKSLEEFYRSSIRKDGRECYCKKCKRNYSKAHRPEHNAASRKYCEARREELRAKARRAREMHPERAKASYRKWRTAHPEACKAARLKREKAHPGAAKAYAHEWRLANPEKVRALLREWRAAHPEAARAAQRRRQAKKHDVTEHFTKEMEVFVHSFWQNECALCGGELNLCVDHWLPLSKGHALTMGNAVILCNKCNGSKCARMPADFLDKPTVTRIERKLRKQARFWVTCGKAAKRVAASEGGVLGNF